MDVVFCFYPAHRIQGPFRPWASASQGGGMCSDSESAGGSSESRSMDSPTASPGGDKSLLSEREFVELLNLAFLTRQRIFNE